MRSRQTEGAKDRAVRYSGLKYALSLIETACLLLLISLFLKLGLSQALAAWILKAGANKFLNLALYLLVASLAYYLLSFPLHFYHSYVLERKFSLSVQRVSSWFKDELKAGLLSYVILFILFSVFYQALKYFIHSWWLVMSLFWIFFNIILTRLTPTLIIPMFFKYKKISDEPLRLRILRLAEKMRVPVLDCFEIDFSKKTLKANAAFVGSGKTRRVILADTLKDKYTPDEIEVILAHEFAHYRLRHLLKLVLLSCLITAVYFYLIFISSSYALELFGLDSLWAVASSPVVMLYFLLLGLITQPFTNYVSRRFERDADKMALEVVGSKGAFISVMNKLAEQNLADRNPHPLIKFFFFDHPPIDERIATAK
jgi:STE24 endopeptidase